MVHVSVPDLRRQKTTRILLTVITPLSHGSMQPLLDNKPQAAPSHLILVSYSDDVSLDINPYMLLVANLANTK